MQFKTIENLSDYLITEKGGVVVKATSELLDTPGKIGYPLRTDEVMDLPATKKTTRLVRRFTTDDIIKLFNSPKAVVVKEEEPATKNDLTISQTTEVSFKPGKHPFKTPYVVYADVPYASARKASAATGVSVNTLLRRCKENKDGNYYVE